MERAATLYDLRAGQAEAPPGEAAVRMRAAPDGARRILVRPAFRFGRAPFAAAGNLAADNNDAPKPGTRRDLVRDVAQAYGLQPQLVAAMPLSVAQLVFLRSIAFADDAAAHREKIRLIGSDPEGNPHRGHHTHERHDDLRLALEIPATSFLSLRAPRLGWAAFALLPAAAVAAAGKVLRRGLAWLRKVQARAESIVPLHPVTMPRPVFKGPAEEPQPV